MSSRAERIRRASGARLGVRRDASGNPRTPSRAASWRPRSPGAGRMARSNRVINNQDTSRRLEETVAANTREAEPERPQSSGQQAVDIGYWQVPVKAD